MQLFAFGERIANFEHAVVWKANYVSRPGLVDGALRWAMN